MDCYITSGLVRDLSSAGTSLERHISADRLNAVAANDDALFTNAEFAHIKYCSECFIAWASQLSTLMVTSRWRCRCGVNVKVITESDRSMRGRMLDVACPRCGVKQMVYGQTLIVVHEEPDNRDFSN
jgi:hypothetical protein